MKARVSLVYDSANPIREGVPRTHDGMPLYPDPSLYSAEIISGFNGWIELTLKDFDIVFCWVDPSEPRFRKSPTLRSGDYRGHVLNLLGLPQSVEEVTDDKYLVENYSQDISVIYNACGENILCLNIRDVGQTSFDIWEFVFVDPRIREFKVMG